MTLTTISVLSGWLGQLVSLVVPKWLAGSESEALLPEDVGPQIERLRAAEDELLSSVSDPKTAASYVDRLVYDGFRYVREGVRKSQLGEVIAKRARKLPPIPPNVTQVVLRMAELRAEANSLTARRGLEVLLTAWLPVHLVSSALAIVVLLGHMVTVVAW